MKKLLTLLLCAVLSLAPPVSAGNWNYIFEYEDVSADDFVNALVAYCNHNEVHNMKESEFELSGHDFRSYNVVRTKTTLDFDYECGGGYIEITLIPPLIFPDSYAFSGHMHVDYPGLGLGNLYGLAVYDSTHNRKFTAYGVNWKLTGENDNDTRFYAKEYDPNRLKLQWNPLRLNTSLIDGICAPSPRCDDVRDTPAVPYLQSGSAPYRKCAI